MRNIVLVELARRWREDAEPPKTEAGSQEAEISNAMAAASRETKRECADTLLTLIDVMPD